ncbi:MAG: ribulokinase [Phycisphaerales bacterium]
MAANRTFSIGVDYGTNSVRALIVDTKTGEEIASSVWEYAHGEHGVILDERDPNLARQHPQDYIEGFRHAVGDAVRAARGRSGFSPERVVGIGVDTTGSTPVPVAEDGSAVAFRAGFEDEPAAMARLWKDHTAHAEAAEITEHARAGGYPYLAKCGGTYSPEWYWAKALHCERHHPRVAQAAYAWVELCDFVPGFLTGNSDPLRMSRSICAAGHKAMYHPSWGGLPSEEFLDGLSPGFARYRRRYAPEALPSDHAAGRLVPTLADQVGLPAHVPVAVGSIDAHTGAVGAGVGVGTLVKIMGTSTCDCMVAPLDDRMPDIPGVCGIVPESILPGMLGIEAGQAAVGDVFNWFVSRIAPSGYGTGAEMHARLSDEASQLKPGESGLVALDWHNGNRNVLADPLLTGLVVGQTLRTTPAEIYRALIEATAFGALKIIERLEEYGVPIERVVVCGGIAEKNPLVMQIYADVCNRPMYVSRSAQTCALGAAIFGSVAGGAHGDVPTAQAAMTGMGDRVFTPDPQHAAVYRRLYEVYTRLHDAFGTREDRGSLYGVMKELVSIRDEVRGLA